MTDASGRGWAGWIVVYLIAFALALLQALIGGRGLLFAYPSYCLLGIAGLIGAAAIPTAQSRSGLLCLAATAIFFGYLFFRALISPGYVARPDLFALIGAVIVYGLTVTIITSAAARMAVCVALIIFGLVHVFIGLIQFSHGNNFMLIPFLQRPDYDQRASGFYACPNHLAGLLEVLGIFGLCLSCWSRWPMWAKLLAGYATAVCYAGLLLTGSRGGYLSAMASLLAVGIASVFVVRSARPKNWPKVLAIGTASLLGIVLLAWTIIHQSGYLNERAHNLIDSRNARFILWNAALQQWKLQPIFGTGAGTYRFYGREFRTQEMQNDPIDVHNDYLHLLCEYGAVGVIGLALFLSAHLRQGWRTLRRFASDSAERGGSLRSNRLALHLGALGAIAAYAAHSVVDFNLHVPANAMLMAFVFGIIAKPTTSRLADANQPRWAIVPRFAPAVLGLILLIAAGRLLPGEYFVERARTALRDEDPVASLGFGRRAVSIDSNNPEAYFFLGRALMAIAHRSEHPAEQKENFQGAIAAFTEAHRLAPLDGSYPLNLAFVCDEIGRFEEAEKVFGIARARDPHSMAVAELYRAHLQSWRKAGAATNPSL